MATKAIALTQSSGAASCRPTTDMHWCQVIICPAPRIANAGHLALWWPQNLFMHGSSKSRAFGHIVPVSLNFMFISFPRLKPIYMILHGWMVGIWNSYPAKTRYPNRNFKRRAGTVLVFTLNGWFNLPFGLVNCAAAGRSIPFVRAYIPRFIGEIPVCCWFIDPKFAWIRFLALFTTHIIHAHQDLWLHFPLAPARPCPRLLNRVAIVAKPRRRLLGRIGLEGNIPLKWMIGGYPYFRKPPILENIGSESLSHQTDWKFELTELKYKPSSLPFPDTLMLLMFGSEARFTKR